MPGFIWHEHWQPTYDETVYSSCREYFSSGRIKIGIMICNTFIENWIMKIKKGQELYCISCYMLRNNISTIDLPLDSLTFLPWILKQRWKVVAILARFSSDKLFIKSVHGFYLILYLNPISTDGTIKSTWNNLLQVCIQSLDKFNISSLLLSTTVLSAKFHLLKK